MPVFPAPAGLIYTPTGWVDDDGSLVVGTTYTAARMNNIEQGIAGLTTQINADALQTGVLTANDFATPAGTCDVGPPPSLKVQTGGVAWVLDTTGILRRIALAITNYTTPIPAPPPSGQYSAVGVEFTKNTQLLVSGAPQASAAAALAAPVALAAGRIRVSDQVVFNNAGVYSVVATRDRRPWARGAFVQQSKTNGNVTNASPGVQTAIDPVTLQVRLECSGAPMTIVLSCLGLVSSAGAAGSTGVLMDGVSVDGTNGYLGSALSTVSGIYTQVGFTYTFTPAAGSHLFTPTFQANNVGSLTLLGTNANPVNFTLSELVRSNSANGIT